MSYNRKERLPDRPATGERTERDGAPSPGTQGHHHQWVHWSCWSSQQFGLPSSSHRSCAPGSRTGPTPRSPTSVTSCRACSGRCRRRARSSMRSMARPLAPSPLTRPAAGGRPPLRSGVTIAGGGNVRSAGQQAAMRSDRADSARMQDPAAAGPHPRRSQPLARPSGGRRRRRQAPPGQHPVHAGAHRGLHRVPRRHQQLARHDVRRRRGLPRARSPTSSSSPRRAPPAPGPRRQPVSGGRRHDAVAEQAPARRQAAAAPARPLPR